MSNTAIPRSQGDDYQTRFFWLQATRMFFGHTKVVKVGFELNDVKAFDDVAAYYSAPVPDGQGGSTMADYFQIKFHVAHNGAFTWRSLMDPAFINASSVSLLQRLHHAQRTFAPDGTGSRFWIVAPWSIDHTDPLGEVVSSHNRAIRLNRLFDSSGPRSTMGQIRREWRQHLGVASDDDLRRVLRPLRIYANAPTLDQLREDMNRDLLAVGLNPVPADQHACVYDDLIRKLRQDGRQTFTRVEIEAIARTEGLWRGTPVMLGPGYRVGVRSFLRFAEHMEDETDEMLCLLRHFDSRTIRDAPLWTAAIFPALNQFLDRVRHTRSELQLQLDAHATIAFAAGYVLDNKSGVNVIPVQRTLTGLTLWPVEPAAPTSALPDWSFAVEDVSTDGQDCALVLSATHDILPDARLYVQQNLPGVRRIFVGRLLPHASTTSVTGGAHAVMLVQSAYRWVRQQRTFDERRGVLHVFISAPNGLVFRLGQEARSLGRCQLYEYDFDRVVPGGYVPSLGLPIADHL